MIVCESKKFEPVKAFAVYYQFQQSLVPGRTLIYPYKDIVHEALKSGQHDLDCPYNQTEKKANYLDTYPEHTQEKVLVHVPHAVCKYPFDGYFHVDYSLIDVSFEEV